MHIEERHQAVALRRRGNSLKGIAEKLHVAKSSVSLWVRDIELSPQAKKRLLTKIKIGQFISAERKRAHTKEIEMQYVTEARVALKNLSFTKDLNALLCALFYWCEGTKNAQSGVCFVNSDPHVIRTFLYLLRNSFSIDESKFRPGIHIHEYHNSAKQLDFWSKVTDIDKRQFIKPYLKPHSGKRIRANYPGCISLRYHSNDLARRLMAIAKAFLDTGA